MKTKSKVKSIVVNYPVDSEVFQDRIAEIVACYVLKIIPPEEISILLEKNSLI